MLTVALSYAPATNTVALTTPAPAYPAYRLVQRRPGQVDAVLPSITIGPLTTWTPTEDDCYPLVVQGGTIAGSVFTVADESAVLYHVQVADHLEAEADNFAKHARRSPAGHPLSDVLYVRARRNEAEYALAESNPAEASQMLQLTHFPA